MMLKKVVLKIHRWLGIASGLVVFVLGITLSLQISRKVKAPNRSPYSEVVAYINPCVIIATHSGIEKASESRIEVMY